uniref:Uncharacterized protein n=1 Tax=Onchocerca volvulus TaxID=6282 RepID=A0A8R1XRG7_ONCVO
MKKGQVSSSSGSQEKRTNVLQNFKLEIPNNETEIAMFPIYTTKEMADCCNTTDVHYCMHNHVLCNK